MNALYVNEKFIRNFPTYHAAVIHGQTLGGRFWVDTDTRVPTREEQLLLVEEPTRKSSRKTDILNSL